MSEKQTCQKCGKVYARLERGGGGMADMTRHAGEMMCPACGGRVIWVDGGGAPMSPYKRMEEANRQLRLGCLWALVALLAWAVFTYLMLR